MAEPETPSNRVTDYHRRLVDNLTENRNAVLNPNLEYDREEFVEFVRSEVLDHATREEDVLYSRIDELAGTELATAGLRRDHKEIQRRIDTLESSEPDGASLPLELHELSALVAHHVETEEEILLPYLSNTVEDSEMNDLVESVIAK